MITALLFLLAVPADPPPQLRRPEPSLVQRGTSTVLELRGARLHQEVRAVLTDATGRVVEAITTAVQDRAADHARLRISVPVDCATGRYELRVVGSAGASNAVDLYVADRRVVRDRDGDGPQELPLPSVVDGCIGKPTEVDRLRFRGRSGETVRFELDTRGLRSPLDGVMTVLDGRGRAVGFSTPPEGGVAALSFQPNADGAFDLVVHDLRFRGGPAFVYHLLAGPVAPAPAVTAAVTPAVTPAGAPAGQRVGAPPFTVHGFLATPGEVGAHEFAVHQKSAVVLAVEAAGSHLDPLLELTRDGKRLAIDDDGGAGNAARLERTLEPGRYVARVRDLLGGGGHRYTLRVAEKVAPAPDFAVRMRPDTLRVRRGGRARVWCEVQRSGGFDGRVDVTFDDLPPGVSVDAVPMTKDNAWTTVFTICASADAPLGPQPAHLIGRATVAGSAVARRATPEAGAHTPALAWLTVLPAAPFTVAPVDPTPAPIRRRWAEERRELRRILLADTPRLRRELEEYRRAHREGGHWIALAPQKTRSAAGSKLEILDDGSVLASEPRDRDAFEVELIAGAGITALRLDALGHPSLPARGPGWSTDNGNFVLSRLLVEVDGRPVTLHRPRARFEQSGHPAASALDGLQTTGWANHPRSGEDNWWIAEPATPIPAGAKVKVTLDQQHGGRHLLGRFRIAAAGRALPPDRLVVPPAVAVALAGSDLQTKALHAWLCGVAPGLAAVRARITELDAGLGHAAAIARLEAELTAAGLTAEMRTALRIEAPKRNAAQRQLAERYRELAPGLRETRARLDRLRAEQAGGAPEFHRGQRGVLAVRVDRRGFAGPVKLTLEGFSSGREGDAPRRLDTNIVVAAVELGPDQDVAVFELRPRPGCELGTRAVVVRAAARVGEEPVVEYGRPLLVTVLP